MIPVRDDRQAWRHVPFGGPNGDEEWVFLGENLTGAVLHMQIRPAEGDSAVALVDLANAASGSQGLHLAWDAGYLDPEPDPVTGIHAVVGGTVVTPLILQATLEAIAASSDPEQPRDLVYDLHVTPSGGLKRLRCFGTFVLEPGVTL